MPKKRQIEPSSLGEVAGGRKGSLDGLKRLASNHPSVRHVLEVVEHLKARPYTTNVVISGEPGTGKEGLAHTLHELMHPEGAPLCTLSTRGRPDDELALELFGRDKRDEGAVDKADGGSLVVDEILSLSPALQRRQFDLVRRGEYRRPDSDRVRHAQLNVIAITDGDLHGEVAGGRFHHDLFHKLARIEVVLPPLRERPEDIPAAALWMANHLLVERGLPPTVALEPGPDEPPLPNGAITLRREALETLRLHRWPVNFRELEIVVERALLLYGDGRQISSADVTRALADPRG
jgi:DNA-binding NtrC family response regulator